MKCFFKKNKILIISISILIIWAIYEISILYGYKLDNLLVESNDPIFYFFLTLSNNFYILQILAPLFIMVPAIYNFHRKINTGFIKNCITRTNYKKYIKSLYKEALKSVIIFPIFLIVLFFLCCILADGFDVGSSRNLYDQYASTISGYGNIYVKFITVFFVNIFLYSIFYVNLSLICCRKRNNLAVSIVLSYLLFIILEIIIEVLVCGLLFSRILRIPNTVNLFSLTGMFMYNDVSKLEYTVIYVTFLVIMSTTCLYFNYKDKEKVLIEIEKNV